MKVKDLYDAIVKHSDKYPDFFEWDVYIEVVDGDLYKKSEPENFYTDCEKWEYIKCFGYHTIDEKKKIFTVNANY